MEMKCRRVNPADTKKEHKKIHIVPTSQDISGPPQEILWKTEAELHRDLPLVWVQPLAVHGQRLKLQLQLLCHQQPQWHPVQRSLHRLRQTSSIWTMASLQ